MNSLFTAKLRMALEARSDEAAPATDLAPITDAVPDAEPVVEVAAAEVTPTPEAEATPAVVEEPALDIADVPAPEAEVVADVEPEVPATVTEPVAEAPVEEATVVEEVAPATEDAAVEAPSVEETEIAEIVPAEVPAEVVDAPVVDAVPEAVVEEVTPDAAPEAPVVEETPAAAVVEEVPAAEEVPVETAVVEPAAAPEAEAVVDAPVADAPVATDIPVEAPIVTDAPEEVPVVETPVEAEVVPEAVPVADEHVREADEADAAIAASPVTAEDSLADSAEAGAQVNDVSAEAAELEEACLGLESALAVMESFDNGMDPRTAQFATIAVEAHVGKWGLGASLVPSMESFGGTQSRIKANSIAVENIKETLSKAYEYVRELFEKAIKSIVLFFQRLLDSAEHLHRRAVSLKGKAGKLEGNAASAEIEIGSLGGRYSIGGKVPANLKDVFARLEKLFEVVKATDEAVAKMEEEAATAVTKILDATESTFHPLMAEIGEDFKRLLTVPSVYIASGENHWHTEVFPGDVVYTADRNPKTGFIKYGRMLSKAEPSTTKAKTISPGDIATIADDAARFANRAIQAKGAIKAAKDQTASPLLKSLKGSASLNDTKAGFGRLFLQEKVNAVQASRAIVLQMFSDGIAAAMAALKVAEASAKQYSAPAAAAAAEGAAA